MAGHHGGCWAGLDPKFSAAMFAACKEALDVDVLCTLSAGPSPTRCHSDGASTDPHEDVALPLIVSP